MKKIYICAVLALLAAATILNIAEAGGGAPPMSHNALYEVSLRADRAFDDLCFRTCEVIVYDGLMMVKKDPALDGGADAARLYLSAAKCYAYRSRYDLAEAYGRRSVELYKKNPGAAGDGLVEATDWLARYLYASAQYAEAETLFRQNLETIKARHGAESEKALECMWRVANACDLQQKETEAEKICLEACATIGRKFGGKHRLLLDFKSELTSAYINTRRYAEAKRFSAEQIGDAERIYGAGSHEAARASHMDAFMHYSLGEADAAIPLFKRTIVMRKAKPATKSDFGVETEAAKSAHNLAIILQAAGKLDEAAKYYEIARDAYRNAALSMAQQAEHDQIKKVLKALAAVYRDLGRTDRAAAAEADLIEDNYARKYYPELKPDWTPADLPK